MTYLQELYLDLMKRCLINVIYSDAEEAFNPEDRMEGRDWPRKAHTMIGLHRLNNLESCAVEVLANRVPGDFIETGVWRGGSTIFMRAVLKAFDIKDRTVWVADSFCGVPSPDPDNYPADAGDLFYTCPELAVSLDVVRGNFERYGLLDEQVKFIKGLFRESLPSAPIKSLSLIRLDGDMYESTMDALVNLYPKLSIGGYLIIDDYGALDSCRKAIHDYRNLHKITDPIQTVDWTGAYWKRSV